MSRSNDLRGENYKFFVPHEDAFHFNKHFWIPDTNLTVFDLDDILSGQPIDDLAYYYSIGFHEYVHQVTGKSGFVYSRMFKSLEAYELLIKEKIPDIDSAIRSQLANDRIHLKTLPFMEATVAFFMDIGIKNFYGKKRDEYLILGKKHLVENRDLVLTDKKVNHFYEMLQKIWKWSGKSERFIAGVVKFSMDIPFVGKNEIILAGNETYYPTSRFEIIFDTLEKLNEKKSLLEIPSISKSIPREKMFVYSDSEKAPDHIDHMHMYQLFSDLTGLEYHFNGGISQDLWAFFRYVQFGFSKDELHPVSQELVEQRAHDIDKIIGSSARKLLLDRHTNYIFVCFKIKDRYILLPNYKYVNDNLIEQWLQYYSCWIIKDFMLKGESKENLLKILEQTLLKEDYVSQEKKIHDVYQKLDYSKINPILVSEFKETSKELNRKLRWAD